MPAMTEAEAFGRIPGINLRAERFRVRVEPCGWCFAEIIAEDDPATWAEPVAAHNRTAHHLAGCRRVGCAHLELEPTP